MPIISPAPENTLPKTSPSSTTTTTVPAAKRGTHLLCERTSASAAGSGYELVIRDLTTGATHSVADDVQPDPTWSPDGATVAYASEQQIWAYTVSTGAKRLLSVGEMPAFSPDGSAISFLAGQGSSVAVISPAGTNQMTIADGFLQGASQPSWSPDGQRLTFYANPTASNTAGVFVVNRDGSNLKRIADAALGAMPAWSPDGTLIAFRKDTGMAVVRPDGTGLQPLPIVSTMRPFLAPAVWSPDSQSIYALAEVQNSATAATVYRIPVRVAPGTPFQVWPDVPIGPDGDVTDWSLLAVSPEGNSILHGGNCGTATAHHLCQVDIPTNTVQTFDQNQPQFQPAFGP